jgi:hypothetical protein
MKKLHHTVFDCSLSNYKIFPNSYANFVHSASEFLTTFGNDRYMNNMQLEQSHTCNNTLNLNWWDDILIIPQTTNSHKAQ